MKRFLSKMPTSIGTILANKRNKAARGAQVEKDRIKREEDEAKYRTHKYHDASSPLVTVVVPLYNEQKFIVECLESMLKQTMQAWECVIVDDCSNDNSIKIVSEFIKKDGRFRLIKHDRNRGLSAARNTGLASASTRFVTFLDSDDYLFETSLWKRSAVLEECKDDVGGAFCQLVLGPEEGPPIRLQSCIGKHVSQKSVTDFIRSRGECPFNVHAPILRTEILKKAGGFNVEMRHGAEDWDLWLRLMRNGYRFFPTRTFGGVYRQKRSSMARALASRHCLEAVRLFELAYSPIKEEHKIEGAPYIYEHGLDYYLRDISLSKRLVGYITLAYFNRSQDEIQEILNQFKPDSWHYLYHHLLIRDLISRAVARYHCLDYREYLNQSKNRTYLSEEETIYNLIKKQTSNQHHKDLKSTAERVMSSDRLKIGEDVNMMTQCEI